MKKLLAAIKASDTSWLILLSTTLFMTACASGPQKKAGDEIHKFTKCENPRPEMCTMDYNPVCGQLKNGRAKTYSNGCSACSDQNVVEHKAGECK